MAKHFSRVRAVATRYDVHPATIWRWSNEERFAFLGFPRPVKIGPKARAWDDDELDRYDQTRADEREIKGAPADAVATPSKPAADNATTAVA